MKKYFIVILLLIVGGAIALLATTTDLFQGFSKLRLTQPTDQKITRDISSIPKTVDKSSEISVETQLELGSIINFTENTECVEINSSEYCPTQNCKLINSRLYCSGLHWYLRYCDLSGETASQAEGVYIPGQSDETFVYYDCDPLSFGCVSDGNQWFCPLKEGCELENNKCIPDSLCTYDEESELWKCDANKICSQQHDDFWYCNGDEWQLF